MKGNRAKEKGKSERNYMRVRVRQTYLPHSQNVEGWVFRICSLESFFFTVLRDLRMY